MPRRIVYKGMVVTEGWPALIEEAQTIFEYPIRGVLYPRVPYGAGEHDLHADQFPCNDCAVTLGFLHVPGCDAERCPACGGQAIACPCTASEDE